MREPVTAEEQVKGFDLSARAKQLAEDLGFGPSGKAGGVILIVVDEQAEQTLHAHAGGGSPMFDALKWTFNELLKKASELLGGEERVSSVRRWREGKKS